MLLRTMGVAASSCPMRRCSRWWQWETRAVPIAVTLGVLVATNAHSAREVDVLRIYPSVTGHPKLGNEYVDGEGRVGVTAAIRLESVIRLTHYLTTHMLHHYSRYSKIFQYAGIHTDWCIPSRTRSVYRVSLSSCSRKNEGPGGDKIR